MAFSPGEMIALAVIFSILPLIVVGLRVWARRIMKAKYAMDDYFVFIALVVCIAAGFTIVYGAIYGEIGRHQDLGPHGEPILTPRLSIHGKVKYASQILELLSFGSAKLSVLFLYRRIFAYSAFTRVANVSILLVAAWTVSFFFTIVFQCSPVSVLWTMLEMDQRPFCVDTMPFFYANSISDVLLDVAILAMPVPLVWGLRLSVRKKLAVGGMFMLGALVCVSSLVRLIIFVQFVPSLPMHITDTTYYESPFSYWSHIEASLGVISACLPVLRPIFVRPKPSNLYNGPETRARIPTAGPNRQHTDRSNLKDESQVQDPFDDKHALVGSEPASLLEKEVEIEGETFMIRNHATAVESHDSLVDTRSGGAHGSVGAPVESAVKRKALPQSVRSVTLDEELTRVSGGLPERVERDLGVGRFREGEMV